MCECKFTEEQKKAIEEARRILDESGLEKLTIGLPIPRPLP